MKTDKKNKKTIVKKKEDKAKKPETKSSSPEKSKKAFSLLRGMHDILPKEERYWKNFYHIAENLAGYFQYGRIDTPILEEASLFIRSIGRGTDVVDKEMYIFEDRDGARVCLRPEATASVARSYIAHGMWNLPQPVKLWYWGPMFRHNRPQAGRYRQFNQVGFEVFGAADPAIDAELILVGYNFYKDAGLPVEVRVNSIGTPAERAAYKTELVNYYRSKKSYLCPDCRDRISRNPLRLLDCKEEQCRPVKEGAPQFLDRLGDESKKHFMKVLEHLEELYIPYVLSPYLVRGLDYYTNTVFEYYPIPSVEDVAQSAQSALGGGGRYDLLVEEMGGRPTPAAGLSLGIERSIMALEQFQEQNKIYPPPKVCDVFFAHLGEDSKRCILRLINDFRDSGLKVSHNFFKSSLKSQLESANSLKAPYVVILGQKEVQDKTVIIRDMESGVQETVDQKRLETVIKKKLEKDLTAK